MKQWWVLFRKEWLEMMRSFKWLWIPLVFIFLGMLEPITYYFLPDIMRMAAGLDGTEALIPTPTGAQTIAAIMAQFGQIGLLVLVLAFMGIVSNERTRGTATLTLVKPVSLTAYVLAKWLAVNSMVILSIVLGFIAGVYYTGLLIEPVSLGNVMLGGAVFSIWMLFIITIMVTLSTAFRSRALTAFATLVGAIVMTVLSSTLPQWFGWLPGHLMDAAYQLVVDRTMSDYFVVSMLLSVACMVLLLFLSVQLLKHREWE